jgi:diacylglycerol kinase family enzyme
VDVAITAAALRTIVAFRNIRVRLRIDGGPDDEVTVTNLGIIRAPHFAGWFSYDTPVADGRLGVNLCGGLSRTGMLAMLAALQKGRFRGRGRTRAWSATEVRVSADREFALEMDGEVVAATEAVFRMRLRRTG